MAHAEEANGRRREAARAFLVYALWSLVVTWPLVTDLARLGVRNPDFYGNTWVLAWDVRQLARDPFHLFDSNIFHPLTLSLAYNEILLPQALMVAPVLLAGGSPVLAHNIAFLLTYALSGWAAYLLARELGANRGGSFLAGLAFGFCPYRFHWINNIQCGSVAWLPLSGLFLLRSLRRGSIRDLVLLALAALAQALSCAYFGLLLVPTLLLVGLWALALRDRPPLARLTKTALALAIAAGVALIFFLPYRTVWERDQLHRGRAEWVHWSAEPTAYLDPGRYVTLPYQKLLHERFAGFEPHYPGACFLALAIWGVARARRRPMLLALLLGGAGAFLSFGPEIRIFGLALPGPFWLVKLLPGGGMLRTPSRFGVLALLAIGLLAGLGWTALVEHRPRLSRAMPLVALLAALEIFPWGLREQYQPLDLPTPASHWLAGARRGPVLELPWRGWDGGAIHVFWSTAHWQPLVNGWGSFQPKGDHFGLARIGERWPAPYVSRVFRRYGIAYIVVDLNRLRPPQKKRLLETPLPEGVQLVADFGQQRIYTISADGPTAVLDSEPAE